SERVFKSCVSRGSDWTVWILSSRSESEQRTILVCPSFVPGLFKAYSIVSLMVSHTRDPWGVFGSSAALNADSLGYAFRKLVMSPSKMNGRFDDPMIEMTSRNRWPYAACCNEAKIS